MPGEAFQVHAPSKALCLDFANTRSWRGSARPTERLGDADAVIGWIGRVALDGGRAGQGRRAAATGVTGAVEADGPALYGEAIAMREAIYRVFRAIAEGGSPAARDAASLSKWIAEAPARSDLVTVGERLGWKVTNPLRAPVRLLAPVLWSAGDLLVAAARERIRRCANDECLWLFLDDSRNGTRRWCDMTTCGNRAKARRFYARSQGRPAGP